MYVLLTYKAEEDQMKHEGARVVTLYSFILDDMLKAPNSVVSCQVWPKIKLIQDLMVVLVACKNKEDPFLNEGARVVTTDLPL